MDLSDYRKRYLQEITLNASARPQAAARGSLLSLVDRYFPDHDDSEPYIDTLGRSDLLRLVEHCGVTPVDQRITSSQVLAGIQALRDEIHQKQTTIDRLYAELTQWKAETDRLQTGLVEREETLVECWKKHEKLAKDLVELHSILTAVYASTSWRITRPIRWLRSMLRR